MVLTCDGVVVALAVIADSAPGGTGVLWDEPCRAVEVLRMITDPDLVEDRVSWILTSWIRDRAARVGHEWVRALVAPTRLAEYWCAQRGWREVRLVRTSDGGASHLLRIRAECIAGIHALVEDRTDQPASLLEPRFGKNRTALGQFVMGVPYGRSVSLGALQRGQAEQRLAQRDGRESAL
ncbi:hypothetical protein [Streptomyces sp. NPDC015350]|uniref:hypothetical protein n=1 Tax=Streptomyces sp. NPDC015350 TaxID=3364955 RepID=UPI0036FB67EC